MHFLHVEIIILTTTFSNAIIKAYKYVKKCIFSTERT